MTEHQDRDLARRYMRGRSEEAFRVLYREHSPYLFCLALRLSGGRRGDAEEALQEAWLRAATGLAGFRWGSRLRTWLAGIVINCCREILRRRPTAAGDAQDHAPPESPQPFDGAMRLDLERQIARLPEGQRTVLVLHDVEGYTHGEIAGLLEIPPGTSKSRLFEARRILRHRLESSERKAGGES